MRLLHGPLGGVRGGPAPRAARRRQAAHRDGRAGQQQHPAPPRAVHETHKSRVQGEVHGGSEHQAVEGDADP